MGRLYSWSAPNLVNYIATNSGVLIKLSNKTTTCSCSSIDSSVSRSRSSIVITFLSYHNHTVVYHDLVDFLFLVTCNAHFSIALNASNATSWSLLSFISRSHVSFPDTRHINTGQSKPSVISTHST